MWISETWTHKLFSNWELIGLYMGSSLINVDPNIKCENHSKLPCLEIIQWDDVKMSYFYLKPKFSNYNFHITA